MAVKPSECTSLQQKELESFRKIEAKIDKELKENFITGGSVKVSFEQPSERVQKRLAMLYTSNGWSLDIQHGSSGFRNEPPYMTITFTEK